MSLGVCEYRAARHKLGKVHIMGLRWLQSIPGLSWQNTSKTAKEKAMVKVLMVCMGNICRSPMAEGVFRRLLQDVGLEDKVYVESAGTHAYHVGSFPDRRSQDVAQARGVDISAIRARKVEIEDLDIFDYVIAMDDDNYRYLLGLCPAPNYREKIHRIMEYAPESPIREVPDPYYGGRGGFMRVMDLVEESAQGLLLQIRERHNL